MDFMDYNDLSKYIIAYYNLYDLEISNKKLQKLMYYCQAWSLALIYKRFYRNMLECDIE